MANRDMARRGLTIIRCHCCSNCIKSTIEKRHYLTCRSKRVNTRRRFTRNQNKRLRALFSYGG
ncbi:hypothetical protein [Klebsiella phage vB_KshKPC-M]|nr:hypothetical protein [Klebsiella phage vB_KshKPC-M]